MDFNPEWLPELALLIAGLILAGVALRALFQRRVRPALGWGLAGIALIAGGIFLGRSSVHPVNRVRPTPIPTVAGIHPVSPSTPAAPAGGDEPDSIPTTALVLGGVEIRVVPADHYTLSVDGRRFLILDTRNTQGLLVSGDIGGEGQLPVRVLRNRPVRSQLALQRPDNNTLLIQQGADDLMRVHFTDPRRIEITGRFHPLGRSTTVSITPKGIQWPGGGATAGTMVDLRHFGSGPVNFEKSGRIRILRR